MDSNMDQSIDETFSYNILDQAMIQSQSQQTPINIKAHRKNQQNKKFISEESFNFKQNLNQIIQQSISKNQKGITTPSKSINQNCGYDRTLTAKIKRKNAKLYQEVCPICLNIYTEDKAKLSCQHQFCFDCISEWAKSSTVCPCCRHNFNQIIKNNKQVIKIQQKLLNFCQLDYYICYNCGSGDNEHVLLICDDCQFYCCHIYCDPQLNYIIPQQEWFCKYCAQKLQNSRISLLDKSQISEIKQSQSQKIAHQTIATRTRSRVRLFETRGTQLRRIRQNMNRRRF